MKLPTLAKRHERKSDEELRAEVAAARAELREFHRAHQFFKDRAHRAIDESIEAAQLWLRGRLARFASIQAAVEPVPAEGRLPWVIEYAAAAGLPALAELWHELAEEAVFSELTHEQFLAEERQRLKAITELEVELERRRVAAEREAADRELAALEERVTA